MASVEQKIKTIHETQINIPLIETQQSNLFALEPATGEILWKYKLKGALYNMFPLRGTPFTMLKMGNWDVFLA